METTWRRENLKKGGSSIMSYVRAEFFKLLIVVVAFAHFVLIGNRVSHWYAKYADQPTDWHPDSFIIAPFLLMLASMFLLFGRWWGNLVAFLISSFLFLRLSFGQLSGISNAHDKPMFSYDVAEYWLRTKYEFQPQELFQVGLALVILGYVVFETSRGLRRRRKRIGA